MPKPKRLSYRLIPDTHAIYTLLGDLVEQHHEELHEARIALAWQLTWKPDVDGRVTLGKCKKASDLDRELAPFDFVILLRQAFWEGFATTDLQRRALLDHELMHATVRLDKFGDPVLDATGRPVYRTRKHDLEEFTAIVDRYGLWKRDVEAFAQAVRRAAPVLPLKDDAVPAGVSVLA